MHLKTHVYGMSITHDMGHKQYSLNILELESPNIVLKRFLLETMIHLQS